MKKIIITLVFCFSAIALFCQHDRFDKINFNNSLDFDSGLKSEVIQTSDYRKSIDSTYVELENGGLRLFLKNDVQAMSVYVDNILEPIREINDIKAGRHWYSIIDDFLTMTIILDDEVFMLINEH